MFYCSVICGKVYEVNESTNFEHQGLTLGGLREDGSGTFHSVLGTGHGFGGSQGSTDCVDETIVYRYGQATPTHIITLK